MSSLPWIVAVSVVVGLVAVMTALVWLMRRPRKPAPLPIEWTLTPRPVFSNDERRVHRLLREALPHHIILAKLPLVRFCQPADPNEVRYWFDLLGSRHVSFAVCSASGRVLAVLDLETERGISRRNLQIKQCVLGACRVRYLRCSADQLPSGAELQMLVPSGPSWNRAPQAAPFPSHRLPEVRESSAKLTAALRPDRSALWQDSALFHDSFFGPENRGQNFSGSDSGLNEEGVSSAVGPRGRSRSPANFPRGSVGRTADYDAEAPDLEGVMFDPLRHASGNRY